MTSNGKDNSNYKDEGDSLTTSEYRSIIHKLNGINKQQTHEVSHTTLQPLPLYIIPQLLQLKADLQDLLLSEKLTPDSYLLAKSYINSDQQEVPISKKWAHHNILKSIVDIWIWTLFLPVMYLYM